MTKHRDHKKFLQPHHHAIGHHADHPNVAAAESLLRGTSLADPETGKIELNDVQKEMAVHAPTRAAIAMILLKHNVTPDEIKDGASLQAALDKNKTLKDDLESAAKYIGHTVQKKNGSLDPAKVVASMHKDAKILAAFHALNNVPDGPPIPAQPAPAAAERGIEPVKADPPPFVPPAHPASLANPATANRPDPIKVTEGTAAPVIATEPLAHPIEHIPESPINKLLVEAGNRIDVVRAVQSAPFVPPAYPASTASAGRSPVSVADLLAKSKSENGINVVQSVAPSIPAQPATVASILNGPADPMTFGRRLNDVMGGVAVASSIPVAGLGNYAEFYPPMGADATYRERLSNFLQTNGIAKTAPDGIPNILTGDANDTIKIRDTALTEGVMRNLEKNKGQLPSSTAAPAAQSKANTPVAAAASSPPVGSMAAIDRSPQAAGNVPATEQWPPQALRDEVAASLGSKAQDSTNIAVKAARYDGTPNNQDRITQPAATAKADVKPTPATEAGMVPVADAKPAALSAPGPGTGKGYTIKANKVSVDEYNGRVVSAKIGVDGNNKPTAIKIMYGDPKLGANVEFKMTPDSGDGVAYAVNNTALHQNDYKANEKLLRIAQRDVSTVLDNSAVKGKLNELGVKPDDIDGLKKAVENPTKEMPHKESAATFHQPLDRHRVSPHSKFSGPGT